MYYLANIKYRLGQRATSRRPVLLLAVVVGRDVVEDVVPGALAIQFCVSFARGEALHKSCCFTLSSFKLMSMIKTVRARRLYYI